MKRKSWSLKQELPPGSVVAAIYQPGFQADLTSWKVTIDEQGNLLQELRGFETGRDERAFIGRGGVKQLLGKAYIYNFATLQVVSNAIFEDADSRWLSFRLNGEAHSLNVDAVGYLAHEGNENAKKFVELWNDVHRFAPYPPRDS